jgi:6-phosphogluconate dehydrogenase
MELGMIGLGRMGANMTERLTGGGHRVIVNDIDSAAIRRSAVSYVDALARRGIAKSIE